MRSGGFLQSVLLRPYNGAMKAFLVLCIVVKMIPAFAGAPAPEAAPAKPETKAAVAPAPKFEGEALKIQENLTVLFEVSKQVNAKGAEGAKARGKIDTALDWDRIAQDCLGKKEWQKQSAANREKFKTLLRDVISKTAYSRLDKFWNGTQYVFDKIQVTGKEAHVVSLFTVNNEKSALEYYLVKKGTQWHIYDVAYEDLRYSVNIAEQITAFLQQNSFAGLLEKLRKRKEELQKEG